MSERIKELVAKLAAAEDRASEAERIARAESGNIGKLKGWMLDLYDSNNAGCKGIISQQFEIVTAESDNSRLRAALEAVEWIYDYDIHQELCPWCGSQQEKGHKPDCQRQAALGVEVIK